MLNDITFNTTLPEGKSEAQKGSNCHPELVSGSKKQDAETSGIALCRQNRLSIDFGEGGVVDRRERA